MLSVLHYGWHAVQCVLEKAVQPDAAADSSPDAGTIARAERLAHGAHEGTDESADKIAHEGTDETDGEPNTAEPGANNEVTNDAHARAHVVAQLPPECARQVPERMPDMLRKLHPKRGRVRLVL